MVASKFADAHVICRVDLLAGEGSHLAIVIVIGEDARPLDDIIVVLEIARVKVLLAQGGVAGSSLSGNLLFHD